MALRLYLGVRNAVGLLRSHVRSCEPLSADDDALIDGSLDRLREFAIEDEAAPDAALQAALELVQKMVAAAGDADRNLRDDEGRCIECHADRDQGEPHDDPDCGLAVLETTRNHVIALGMSLFAEFRALATPPAEEKP